MARDRSVLHIFFIVFVNDIVTVRCGSDGVEEVGVELLMLSLFFPIGVVDSVAWLGQHRRSCRSEQ